MAETEIKTTITDELKTAADKLRTTAYGALSGPWQSLDDGDRLVALNDTGRAWANVLEEPVGHAGTAAWIALVNPLTAPLLIDLLDHIGLDMELASAEEKDFPDHVPQYQRMVAELRGFETQGAQVVQWVDRMDWTAALALARFINGVTPQEVASRG